MHLWNVNVILLKQSKIKKGHNMEAYIQVNALNLTINGLISADFALGAGIAKEFTKRGVKKELLRRYGIYADSSVWVGKALETHATDWNWEYNLVTKEHYWGKPNYVTLEMCLKNLRDVYVNHNEHLAPKLAMPWLGCGLDKLERWKVEVLIKDVFKNCERTASNKLFDD